VKQAEWCNSMYWLYRYYQRIDEAEYADYYLGMHSAGCLDLAEPKTLITAALHRIKSHVILRLRSLRFWNPLTLRAAFRRIFRKKQ